MCNATYVCYITEPSHTARNKESGRQAQTKYLETAPRVSLLAAGTSSSLSSSWNSTGQPKETEAEKCLAGKLNIHSLIKRRKSSSTMIGASSSSSIRELDSPPIVHAAKHVPLRAQHA